MSMDNQFLSAVPEEGMSLGRHGINRRVLFTSLFVLLAIFLWSAMALAQQQPVPKVELFTGYQWLNPGGTIPSPNGTFQNPIPFKLPGIPQGVGLSGTYNFTPIFGLEADYGGNWNKFANESTGSIGPRVTWRTDGVNLFAHTMVGINRLTPKGLDPSDGFGAVLGGGIDLTMWKHIYIRLFEADYVLGRQNFSANASPVFPDLRHPVLEGARLRGGLVWNFGFQPETPPTAACQVQPAEVMVGEPITATATGSNFDQKHTLTYTWSSNGGKVTGKDNTASIDTNGVAGGSYTVTAHVADAKRKKNGEATCTANFTVKEPPKNPPTMSCTANPASVQAGTPSTITCTCTSPDNVPVTVSNWTASAGTVSGTDNTATLNTNGAPSGQITVTASCSDSRGLNSSSSTTVNVENPPPPPPPPPTASKLSECDFPNPAKPWRVDNTCKAVLDDVAQRLQHEADAKVVIVGNADPKEKRKNLAGTRAVDAKAYLSGGEAKQAIDASRVDVRTGNEGTKTTQFWIVPAGATFDEANTMPVDESKVKPIPDHPHAAAKKAPKAQQ
jgi:hypothetical protein